MDGEARWSNIICYNEQLSPSSVFTVEIDPQGRLALPDPLRERLDVAADGTLIAYLDGTRLIVERKGEARARLFEMAARLASGKLSLSDELIAERRAAAQSEHHD